MDWVTRFVGSSLAATRLLGSSCGSH
jgi:hypothetical protein